jgi:hypothetical protein
VPERDVVVAVGNELVLALVPGLLAELVGAVAVEVDRVVVDGRVCHACWG